MELANIGFALLCIKLGIGVIPIVLGIFLIAADEEKKRIMRSWFCIRLFEVSNAIPYPKFARALSAVGVGLILFGLGATWFLVLRPFVSA